ncbi:hypothetical protein HGG72_19325 [Ochrobactrum pecoris]|nr:hypothetical protein [Brucella pecoris]
MMNLQKNFLGSIGVEVKGDFVFPDIAFNLPPPPMHQINSKAHKTVGVGVMNYRGWSKADPDAELIYRTYQEKLSQFIIYLINRGFRVRLLTGDIGDQVAVSEMTQKVRGSMSKDDTAKGAVFYEETTDLHELMQQIDKTDMVVASRYHNIVCALKMGKPLISIGYNDKNDFLMAEFSQIPFCQRIESLDLDRLQEQFDRLLQNYDSIKSDIKAANVNFSVRSNEQNCILLEKIQAFTPITSGTEVAATTL